MESAVKALLIAAGMLIGGMIISLGISLYTSLNQYVEDVQDDIVSKEVQQFNEQFIKYINCNAITDQVDFTLTIQDIVTAANTAYENNLDYGLTQYDGNNYYVTIKLDGTVLEKTINSFSAKILAEGIKKQYKCSNEDIKINSGTGRVYEVNFHEYTMP